MSTRTSERPPRAPRGEPIPFRADLAEAGALAFEGRLQGLDREPQGREHRSLGLQQSGSGALLDEVSAKSVDVSLQAPALGVSGRDLALEPLNVTLQCRDNALVMGLPPGPSSGLP